MTTADDVKRVLREYANDNFPGRRVVGSAQFKTGDGPDEWETLMAYPTDPAPPGATSASPPPPSASSP